MSAHSHEHLIELAAAYVLGATTPDETRAIEAALPHSPDLAAEVRSFREVTARMAQSEPVQPSTAVRERLMQQVAAVPSPAARATPVTPIRRRGGWFVPAALAAASLVAVVSTAQLMQYRAQLRTTEAQLARREATLDRLLLAEGALRVVQLRAADTVNGPGIQLFWDAGRNTAVIHAFRLPPAAAGRAYQVWAIVDGKPLPLDTFNSDPDGHALIEGMPIPASMRSASALAITEEPVGGSREPTTVPFLVGGTGVEGTDD